MLSNIPYSDPLPPPPLPSSLQAMQAKGLGAMSTLSFEDNDVVGGSMPAAVANNISAAPGSSVKGKVGAL